MDFDNGRMGFYGKTQSTPRNIVAVRGSQADGFIRTQKTGQLQTHRPSKLDDDGALELGVPPPTPRFVDQGDGTILDRFTGFLRPA